MNKAIDATAMPDHDCIGEFIFVSRVIPLSRPYHGPIGPDIPEGHDQVSPIIGNPFGTWAIARKRCSENADG